MDAKELEKFVGRTVKIRVALQPEWWNGVINIVSDDGQVQFSRAYELDLGPDTANRARRMTPIKHEFLLANAIEEVVDLFPQSKK